MEETKNSKGLTIAGWVLSIITALPFVPSAAMKLHASQEMIDGWTKSGLAASTLMPIGIVEVLCIALYLIPRTSVLGAILVAGYLGGAIHASLQMGGTAFLIPLLCGILAWGGLFLRDPRIRKLIPINKCQ